MTGRSSGLNPKIAFWIYTAIVRPMLSYGALVWWLRAKKKQQLCNLNTFRDWRVTGAMRTTSAAVPETLLCLAALNLYIEEAAMRTSLIRLHSLGVWYKQGRITAHLYLDGGVQQNTLVKDEL